MEKQFVTTSDTPVVIVEEIGGDLKLKGWDDAMVVVKNSNAEDISLEQRGDEVVIRCTSYASVRVPRQAVVTVKTVNGNAALKGLEGALNIGEVNGDLELRSVGPSNISAVHGNLSAKNISGDLAVGTVSGDATARDVQGDCTVKDFVGGNLRVDDVDGSASGRAQGDIVARLDPTPGESFNFSAYGNIVLRMPDDAGVQLKIECDGNINVKLADQQAAGSDLSPYEVTLGDGDATVSLSARGDVNVTSQSPDWEMGDFGAQFAHFGKDFGESFEGVGESIAEQMTSQIESQMEMLEQQLESQMEHLTTTLGSVGLSEEQRQRVAERARQAGERAAERAREKAHQAQERLERKLEAARRRAEAHARHAEHRARTAEQRAQAHVGRHSWNFNFPTPPIPPVPPVHDAVSDEERVTILRMLEQKKISLDEAEKLLAALEGK